MKTKSTLPVLAAIAGVSGVVSAQIETHLNQAFPIPRQQLDERAGFAPVARHEEIVEPSETMLMMQRHHARKQARPDFNLPVFLPPGKRSKDIEVSERSLLQLSIEQAELTEKLGAGHPAVKAIRDEVEVMRRRLKAMDEKHGGVLPPMSTSPEVERYRNARNVHESLRQQREKAQTLNASEVNESRESRDAGLNQRIQELRDRIARNVGRLRDEVDNKMQQTEKIRALQEAARILSASGLEGEAQHLHRRAKELEKERYHREQQSEPEHIRSQGKGGGNESP